jgi:cytidyltransferase-like protein
MKFRELLVESEKTVGLFVGRFQPLTLAHTNIIETISKENDKCIIFLVKAKKKNIELSPFDEELQRRMLDEIIDENTEVVTLPSAFFVDYISTLPYSNYNIYAGSDRVESYKQFNKYMNEGKSLDVSELSRVDEDISATKVRTALLENDNDTFNNLTDIRIHKYFKELRHEINNKRN